MTTRSTGRRAIAWPSTPTLRCAWLSGTNVFAGVPGACVGVCGKAWMVQFARDDDMRFYGQGEKVTGLEKTGKRTKFWNLDVWADHPMPVIIDGQADPQYAAVPYLLIRNGSQWIGVLVDTPGQRVHGHRLELVLQRQGTTSARRPACGSAPTRACRRSIVIAGNSAADVTRRLQRLVGVTPLPPLWSLGYHQCRWGLQRHARPAGARRGLHRAPDSQRRPVAGHRLHGGLQGLHDEPGALRRPRGRDQGPHRQGPPHRADPRPRREGPPTTTRSPRERPGGGHLLPQPEGQPYVGFVWPGRTWFPDYLAARGARGGLATARQFRDWGFSGA